jgi:hypothetical protein
MERSRTMVLREIGVFISELLSKSQEIALVSSREIVQE